MRFYSLLAIATVLNVYSCYMLGCVYQDINGSVWTMNPGVQNTWQFISSSQTWLAILLGCVGNVIYALAVIGEVKKHFRSVVARLVEPIVPAINTTTDFEQKMLECVVSAVGSRSKGLCLQHVSVDLKRNRVILSLRGVTVPQVTAIASVVRATYPQMIAINAAVDYDDTDNVDLVFRTDFSM